MQKNVISKISSKTHFLSFLMTPDIFLCADGDLFTILDWKNFIATSLSEMEDIWAIDHVKSLNYPEFNAVHSSNEK